MVNLTSQVRFIRTLRDIGPRRLQRRVRYEMRQRVDRLLPAPFARWLAGAYFDAPCWSSDLKDLEVVALAVTPASLSEPSSIRFSFLNQPRQLDWPILWNDMDWPRLWQFHLHYFDWAREWLELSLVSGRWSDEAFFLEQLTDQWIASNPLSQGDGWHSYTLSLRIRNWIWLFRTAPQLATPRRLQSLWQQMCWLESHPESCHGGNHWLENLIALAISSLQFTGGKAKAMHHRSLKLLQRELSSQVLADGGHEERSAAYHLLMLDRLVELGCVLMAAHGLCPHWLKQAIVAMTTWAVVVRLEGGRSPRFNDSAEDTAPPLDEVVGFAQTFLLFNPALVVSRGEWPRSGLRRNLLKAMAARATAQVACSPPKSVSRVLVEDLPQTGWTFLRPGHGWELIFKCGVPCPNHLPSHVHSDQLSLELYHYGKPFLCEAGTSIYEFGEVRAYERSGEAHNVLQLAPLNSNGEVMWLEPVEVWNSFRAARKAQPTYRRYGTTGCGTFFAEGSHNAYRSINASHSRRVELSNALSGKVVLKVSDLVKTKVPLHFRQWWHLGPEILPNVMDAFDVNATMSSRLKKNIYTTWIAQSLGVRTPRYSLCVSGMIEAGTNCITVCLPFANSF